MPGAPNRPPEKLPELPVAPPVPVTPEQKALRRLAPSRVALLLDVWKGNLSPELTGPYEKAEEAFARREFGETSSALDLLSIRFTEPRWPSLPEPFRRLRVPIPAPMPPHWDPEHALTAADREMRRAHRAAEDQLALAGGTVVWARAHGVAADDLAAWTEEARATFGSEGASPGFFERIDRVWTAVRERTPLPKSLGRAPPASAVPDPADA